MNVDLVEQMGRDAFNMVIYGILHEKQPVSYDQITTFLRSRYPGAADQDIEASMDRACGIYLEYTRPLIQQANAIQASLEEFQSIARRYWNAKR